LCGGNNYLIHNDTFCRSEAGSFMQKMILPLQLGKITEWLNFIEPTLSNDRRFEHKLKAILETQLAQLINGEENEIRTCYWVIRKVKNKDGFVSIIFSVIAHQESFLIDNSDIESEAILKREFEAACESKNAALAGILKQCLVK
jgi:hypothetical protein